jgi:hypothetical protein
MADYRAAGLNPMIAGMNPASTPSIAPARVENAKASLGQGVSNAASSAASAASALQTSATTENIQAQTAKTLAETRQIEAVAPYTGETAALGVDTLRRNFVKLGHEIHQIMREETLKDIEIDEIKPLLIQYQKLVNESTRLGQAGQRAEAQFYESIGSGAKWAELLRRFLPGLSFSGRLGGKVPPVTTGPR